MNTFLDTNVIVYANDYRDPAKQRIASKRITQLLESRQSVVSTQVLAEFANTALRLGISPQVILQQFKALETGNIVQVTPAMIRRGLELREMYGVHFWDGCILAAAEVARCPVLVSENLNPGQLYAGVKVENPFA